MQDVLKRLNTIFFAQSDFWQFGRCTQGQASSKLKMFRILAGCFHHCTSFNIASNNSLYVIHNLQYCWLPHHKLAQVPEVIYAWQFSPEPELISPANLSSVIQIMHYNTNIASLFHITKLAHPAQGCLPLTSTTLHLVDNTLRQSPLSGVGFLIVQRWLEPTHKMWNKE